MVFAINDVGPIEKVSLDLYLTPYTKINSRWTADLNVKGQIFLNKKDNQFLNRTQEVLTTKGET